MNPKIKITLLFSIVYFFYYLCRLNFSMALPFIKEEFQVSNMQLGSIATALTLGYAFGQLFNGFLTDRLGPRIIMVVGGLVSSVLNFIMGANVVFGLFLLIWAANGYFQAMGYPATCKLIATWFGEDDRGKPLGISEMFQSIASLVTIPLSAVLTIMFGWRMLFFTPSIMLSGASLGFYLLSKDFPDKREKISLLQDAKLRYGETLKNWRLILANFSYGFSTFVKYALITWIPSYLYTISGHDLYKVAWFGILFQVGGIIGSPLIGYISDRFFNTRKWLLIFMGMLGAGISGAMVGSFTLNQPLGIISMLILCGALVESLEVPYFLLPIDCLGVKHTATGIGVMNATGKFVASLQGILLGYIIDISGFQAAFVTAGLFGVASSILILPSRKIKRNKI